MDVLIEELDASQLLAAPAAPAPPPAAPADRSADPGQPRFHVAPRCGWLNDPNGLIYYRGRYHLFYQHVEQGCEWDWGLVWGHAVSDDLATWRHLPPALRPTPGSGDADGCWSGCTAVSSEGVPTLLYTGVRLRSNDACGPPPPPERDNGLPFIETQLAAVLEDPDDELLLRWRKLPAPALALPPAGTRLMGWRDPFVYLGAGSAIPAGSNSPTAHGSDGAAAAAQPRQQGGASDGGGGSPATHRMLVGSGIAGQGGALLGYCKDCGGSSSTSVDGGSSSGAEGGSSSADGGSSLAGGWRYTGPVCSAADLAGSAAALASHGASEQAAAVATMEVELGEVWECPLLCRLPRHPGSGGSGGATEAEAEFEQQQLWLLAVSPYPHSPASVPSNPVLYWIGRLSEDGARFDLGTAAGPHRLDHGEVMYAPNGRTLLWAWLQERRLPGVVGDYSGCLTLPRQLAAAPDGRRLLQQPATEVSLLRRRASACGDGAPGAGSKAGGAPCAGPHTAAWYAEGVEVPEVQPLWVDGPSGQQLDVELVLRRGSAAAAGLLLLSHAADSQGSALLTYDWRENSLTVRFGVPAPGAGAGAAALRVPPPPAASSPRKAGTSRGAGGAPVDPAAAAVAAATGFAVEAQLAQLAEPLAEATAVEAAVAAEAAAANAAPRQHRRLVGGTLTAPAADAEGRVRLRVLLDGSALEVYTGSGEVLSTRVYRGTPPGSTGAASLAASLEAAAVEGAPAAAAEPAAAAAAASGCGIGIIALGGTALLESGAAWEMCSCWVGEEDGEAE
ncbi:Arabinanase levansucrase invertase [Micractinium conductrix]|uniref:beta-fructofuranosidase n=1 Tax=Micractinium conductrix TaxID=554055 RepID=A0A2P6VM29_9CHLO|nr:Arabinanase levansucrase invertase [Micractinium conductrix]|eukprot:PSC75140.1 Arabinanase levansucrase invertase [Micractinium conductrix]